jgi:predicted PurR-regulated permease PerM
MDITSFLMGICAVTVVVLITVVVAGMFRINRLAKELDRTVKEIENIKRVIDSRVDSLRSILEKEDLNLHQRIDNMFPHIESQDRDLHQRIDELSRQFTNNK